MIWIVMIATGCLTFLIRFSMLSGFAPKKLPTAFENALGFVPIAVLTSIIGPAVLLDQAGAFDIAGNQRLPAAIIATGVALLTRSAPATIASGLIALWGLDWLVY